jgi:hypothetical protein
LCRLEALALKFPALNFLPCLLPNPLCFPGILPDLRAAHQRATFCANFSRLSKIGSCVKQSGDLSRDGCSKPGLRHGPNLEAQAIPAQPSSSHSAICKKQPNARKRTRSLGPYNLPICSDLGLECDPCCLDRQSNAWTALRLYPQPAALVFPEPPHCVEVRSLVPVLF